MGKMIQKLTAAFLSSFMLFSGIGVRAESTPVPSSSPEPTVEASASAEPSTELYATSGSKDTLSANWRTNEYTIVFDGNGADGGSMPAQSLTYDAKSALSANAFTRTGYSFSGWNTSADGKGTAYADQAQVSNLSAKDGDTVPLYAQWSAITYHIAYDLNGGTGAGDNPTTYTVESGAITLIAPTRTGYTFTGWTGANGTTPQTVVTIASGSIGDKSYKANWTANKYIVTLAKRRGIRAFDAFTFESGPMFNAHIKNMVGSIDNADPSTLESRAVAFKFSNKAPAESDNAINVDDGNGGDIQAWFERSSGTVYLHLGSDDPDDDPDRPLLGPPVAYLNSDSSYMFAGFNNLKTVDLSGFAADGTNNMAGMFQKCGSLTSIDFSSMQDFDTSPVTDMSLMFDGCESLTNLDVGRFNTSAVTNMRYMFSDCKGLQSLDVSKFDTALVTDMSYMFSGDSSLSELDVSNFNTASATDMQHMFDSCTSLKSLNIGGFKTQNVKNMASMFANDSQLQSLDVNGFDTSNVSDMNSMFASCGALTTIDVTGFDTNATQYMQNMFMDCSGIQSLDISSFNTKNAVYMRQMFQDMQALNTIKFGSDFVIPSGEYMNNYSDEVFPTPTKTASGEQSNGYWGLGSETAVTHFSPSELNEYGKTAQALNGTWYAQKKRSVFEPGDAFNVDIKNLAESSTNASVSTVDTSMLKFIRSTTAPASSVTTIDISDTKDNSIQAWLASDGSTVYWYAADDTAYMNANSRDMFSDFEGAKEIDLSGVSTSLVTDATGMFHGIRDLVKITFGHDFIFPEFTEFDSYTPSSAYNGGLASGTWGTSAGTAVGRLTTSNDLVLNGQTSGAIAGAWYALSKPLIIHFNANGGSGTMEDFQVSTSSMESALLPVNKFTKDGYDFVEWNTNPGGSGQAIPDQGNTDSIIRMGDSVTLYAQWRAEKPAKLETGPKFNQDVKGLTPDPPSYNGYYGGYNDYQIRKMVRSTTAPTDGTVTVDISEAKDGSIVAWFDKDNSTLYWYSSAHKILMNEDCSHMFEIMTVLKSVDMTGWNAQLVTDTSFMFRWDYMLSDIDATIFNSAKNLQSISAMFQQTGIKTIDVSGWQTSNLVDASYAFSNTMLTAIDLSAWNTSKISAMSGMFQGCGSLTTIDVADWETGSVIDMSNMFYDCRILASLNLSNWDTKNVTDMRYFIGNDSALTTMTFGENFITPLDATMRQSMFSAPVKTASGKDSDGRWGLGSESADTEYAATALADLGTTAQTMAGTWYAQPLKAPKLESGPKFNVALKTLTANGSASSITSWSENSSIKKFTRSSDAPASGITTADISDKQDKSIVAWFDADTGTIYWHSATDTVLMNESSDQMFADMTALESVDGSGLDSTIVSSAYSMFEDDKSLKNVDATILNDAVGLYNIASMFENCTNLEKVDVSGWQSGNLNNIGSAFQDCSSLKTLDVSKWNLSNAQSLDSVFAGCSSLTGLNVSNWDTSNVTTMDSTFSGCSSLVSIDVSKWDTSHVYGATRVFNDCSRLSTIDFSGWNTKGFDTMNELLSGCTNLRTITFGDGFIAPSGTETEYLRKDMFPAPLLTVSDHNSNGKWGFGSEMASHTYTPGELAEHATTAKAMTGTWYAQMDGVTVTLDPNGGGGTKIVITLPKNKPTPIPDPTDADPRRPFEGWSTTPDGSSGVTPSGETITLTEDTTLYAQWGDNPYLPDAGGIGVTSVVALAALSGALGLLMKHRRA